jgi:hypothetical protein
MSEDKEFLEMCCLNSIENVCNELDFLSDPAIEEQMGCSFDCHIAHSRSREIFKNPPQEIRDLLGDEGLKLTHQLDELVMQGIERVDYGETEGFSKTQEWLDFVSRINKIKFFLKDILQKHGRIID